MQISGLWLLCDDGVERPVIHGEVLAAYGTWVKAPFLVDTAADRTVLSADILAALALQLIVTSDQIGGVGGIAPSVVVETQIRFTSEASAKVVFRSWFAGITDTTALDISVLGRDITKVFAVIVDQPGSMVCLLGQRHQYRIEHL